MEKSPTHYTFPDMTKEASVVTAISYRGKELKKLFARIIVRFLLLRSFCSQAVLVGGTIQSRHLVTAGPEVYHQLTPMMINMVE